MVKLFFLRAWRWLTSMRTALILLFLLALAAVPGALLPQRSLNESKVTEYIASGGKTAEVMDKLQLFDVFSSPWFTAIWLLLGISLVGCIIPRTWDHIKVMRGEPVRPPKNLGRLPKHGEAVVDKPIDQLQAEVTEKFSGWHSRWYQPAEDRAGALTLSAEKGYAREIFNLVFHLGIVAMLVVIGWGRLVYTEGHRIVVADGQSNEFCNTALSNFDSFRAGRLVDGTKLTPFCVQIHDFDANYMPNGQSEMYKSHVSYTTDVANPQWQDYDLKVNDPLRIEGYRVYLQGHGYAPTFTVIWPNGEERTQTLQFRPDDPMNLLSTGAMRFDPPAGLYPDDLSRRQNQVSLQGLFAPTASWDGTILASSFPALTDPAVAIDVYRGDNGLDSGTGQQLFSLDARQIAMGELQKVARVNLMQGESVTLEDGTVVRFDGAVPFANLQVSYDPSQGWLLVSTLIMLAGLVGSLMVKRRRMWVRLTPAGGTRPTATRVETGGLARTDHAGWGAEHDEIFEEITSTD